MNNWRRCYDDLWFRSLCPSTARWPTLVYFSLAFDTSCLTDIVQQSFLGLITVSFIGIVVENSDTSGKRHIWRWWNHSSFSNWLVVFFITSAFQCFFNLLRMFFSFSSVEESLLFRMLQRLEFFPKPRFYCSWFCWGLKCLIEKLSIPETSTSCWRYSQITKTDSRVATGTPTHAVNLSKRWRRRVKIRRIISVQFLTQYGRQSAISITTKSDWNNSLQQSLKTNDIQWLSM